MKIAARCARPSAAARPGASAVRRRAGFLLLTVVTTVGGVGGTVRPVHRWSTPWSALVTFHRLAVGLALAACAIRLRGRAVVRPDAGPQASSDFSPAASSPSSALLNVVSCTPSVAPRRERRRRPGEELASMRQEARDFRLISTSAVLRQPRPPRAEEEQKLSQARWRPSTSSSSTRWTAEEIG